MKSMFARAAVLTFAAAVATPAAAQEVFAGLYAHEVETPFTFDVNEGGADIELGYRFAPSEGLSFLGRPQPYVLASLNTEGDTSFAGGGLSWKLGKGKVYARPGIGIVIHDGPSERFDPETRERYDLGSRVLFSPEIAIGYQVSDRVALEASWVHISHAQLFNSEQNPGIDMIGARINLSL
ncbi:acyloxyacyl hydrolase [Qipengyuania atrilutea]|uniref:Acyloxyacyl hydrolase n=1 Tax=Qipengyuania atrilutea TaxID=2744473 RepID=A0A850H4C5_9SPHN|nr:acyloxyacyl hydrolase [Actirhodobacter atriluteus]NVD44723.1 acyloxyacyl hydrolase [Actirhodobacter atriluteus]